MNELEENGNVTVIKLEDKTVYLLGTAHVSSDSAEDAKKLIEEIKPDSVCIELDKERLENMLYPKKWSDTDIADIIRQKKAAFLMANLILSSYQKRLADKFGIKVGQEMLVAIQTAKESNIPLVTIDRNIKTTFMRIWRKMSLWGKLKLIFNLIFSFVDDEEISKSDLEELKNQDMLQGALSELSAEFPEIKKYLVDERDEFLTDGIKNAPGKKVVAIVGAAHTIGIKKLINEDISQEHIKEIDSVPPAGKTAKVVGWLIPVAIIVMFAVTLFKDPSGLLSQLKQWVLYNGTLSALGVVFAGGHIYAILTAFVAAPITSLNPLLAAGWFAGFAQAKAIKPTVSDVEALSDDLSTFKGFRSNKFTRVLLVVIFGNLGSVVGTIAAGVGIFNIFIKALGI